MKLICISDTHGQHRSLNLPDGDILIHAGDMTGMGSLKQIKDLNKWLGEQPHKYKILIAGNHDWTFYEPPKRARHFITNAIYLEDNSIVIEGLKIYGSPWTPTFMNWAFMKEPEEIRNIWKLIPKDTDILITHGPSYEVMDMTKDGRRVGCPELRKVVEEIKPKIHIFGHIHEGYGIKMMNEHTIAVNASSLDENYYQVNDPIVVDI